MSSYDISSTGHDTLGGPGDPEAIKADIERTRNALADDVNALTGKTDPRERARQALSAAKTKTSAAASQVRTAAPQKARQAGQAVRGNPKTSTAALFVLVAAAAGAVLTTRSRAAKARAARSRWSRLTGR